jgi:hypothetical protein
MTKPLNIEPKRHYPPFICILYEGGVKFIHEQTGDMIDEQGKLISNIADDAMSANFGDDWRSFFSPEVSAMEAIKQFLQTTKAKILDFYELPARYRQAAIKFWDYKLLKHGGNRKSSGRKYEGVEKVNITVPKNQPIRIRGAGFKNMSKAYTQAMELMLQKMEEDKN